MKIPTDTLAPSLLKPLDAESQAASLDSSRLSLDQLGHSGAAPLDHASQAAQVCDPGETILGSDAWNGIAEGARRLDLSGATVFQVTDAAVLDKAADAIIAGLN
jgi:hypothetical protein